MHRDWSARLISVTWPEAVRPSTFWRRLSALFLFILSKRLPDCPWRLVESWAQSSNLSCCRFGPQTSLSSREPPCCPGRKWRGFLFLPITNLKGFAEFRLHCADERLKLMEMAFESEVKRESAANPVLSSFLFCIKVPEAQQRRAGSKSCPQFTWGCTLVSVHRAGMGEDSQLGFLLRF